MSMTESELNKELERVILKEKKNNELARKALKQLELIETDCPKVADELKQYRAIGTVSEFQQLKEKATAKKPVKRTDNDGYVEFYCPNCDAHLFFDEEQKFCNECGQAIEV